MAGAGNAGKSHGRAPGDQARGGRGRDGEHERRGSGSRVQTAVAYFRANPQVFVLLVICLVLGLGTFLAVVFGLLTAGPGQSTGEPSGAVMGGWVFS
jgi:hypothetical protein